MWAQFTIYSWITFSLWFIGLLLLFIPLKVKQSRNLGAILIAVGVASLIVFTCRLWIFLERPPLRTLGETRLWYALFLPIIGLLTYTRWKYRWFLTFSILMAVLFQSINLTHPETYDKALMPALQSIWFVPHVIVYIFSYVLLAASSLVSIIGIYQIYRGNNLKEELKLADNLVYSGFAFLTMGLLFGALWAKEAWGHYWTWDPKETWSFLTWLIYLIYIHFRKREPKRIVPALWMLGLAFVVLLVCWFGINYLPSAQNSVHVYNQ
jgi:ABC-type transport system involved in cytochrome c biogenesis permease subunit